MGSVVELKPNGPFQESNGDTRATREIVRNESKWKTSSSGTL